MSFQDNSFFETKKILRCFSLLHLFNRGIYECAPDYFGIRCECDAVNSGFSAILEDGCRPDNTTTTLCNNRGDCSYGYCVCHPRDNPLEVKLLILILLTLSN